MQINQEEKSEVYDIYEGYQSEVLENAAVTSNFIVDERQKYFRSSIWIDQKFK